MKNILSKVKDIKKYPSVTITLPTHRTSPENKQDPIRLKNLIKGARERLAGEFSKREMAVIENNLERLEDAIDHNFNKEGLIIFVNDDLVEVARVPFPIEENVYVDSSFAIRHIVRAIHSSESYYILTLSQQKARLFEAYNKAVNEITDFGFPMENQLYPNDTLQKSMGGKEDDLIREFFNRVDKNFQEAYRKESHEVFICTVERNHQFYQDVTDNKSVILGGINRNADHATLAELSQWCWPKVSDILKKRRHEVLEELARAESANKVKTDMNDMWRASGEGRCDTLIVEKNFMQPAIVSEDRNSIKIAADAKAPGVYDDIIDEIIERAMQTNSRVVFVDDGSLEKYQRMAMILRY